MAGLRDRGLVEVVRGLVDAGARVFRDLGGAFGAVLVLGPAAPQEELDGAADAHQQVVEVVGDAAGQLADGLLTHVVEAGEGADAGAGVFFAEVVIALTLLVMSRRIADAPPEESAKQAIENDVHIIGASSLAAGHLTLVPQLRQARWGSFGSPQLGQALA